MIVQVIGFVILLSFLIWVVAVGYAELRRSGYHPYSTMLELFHRVTSGKYRYTTKVEGWPGLGELNNLLKEYMVRTDSFYGGFVCPGDHTQRLIERRPLSWILIWRTRRNLRYLMDEERLAMAGERFRPLMPFYEAMRSALDDAERVSKALLTTTFNNARAEMNRQDSDTQISDLADSNLRIARFSAVAAAASAVGTILQVLSK